MEMEMYCTGKPNVEHYTLVLKDFVANCLSDFL